MDNSAGNIFALQSLNLISTSASNRQISMPNFDPMMIVNAAEQPPAAGVADMMSNLSIQATEFEPIKVAEQAPVIRQQQAPQTRAPAVTRRSTFHTDKEETAISAPPLQQSGYEGDRSYEISAQDRKDLRSDTINYDAQRMIGHGSFGAVFLAKVVETDDVVAIKKVLQDKRFKNRELQIMRQIAKQPHPYVVALRHHFISKGSKSDDVYLNLVLEYIPETVYSVAKHYNRAKESVPLFSVRLYMYQLCRSLAHIHGMGICHRDIKPQNLLVDPVRQVLKLCDFGSAKALVKGEPNVAYICSRYYRAPELIFGSTDYTTAIDVWSAGCVLAELLTGSPIFPGSSGVDQLVEIIKVLGTPTKEQLKSMNPNYQEFKFPQIGAHPWSSIFKPTIPPETVDLVGNLLSYVPDLRCKAIEACGHPFFDDFRNPATRMPDGSPLPEELYQLSPEELVMAPEMEAILANYPGRGKVTVMSRVTSGGDTEA